MQSCRAMETAEGSNAPAIGTSCLGRLCGMEDDRWHLAAQ